MNNKKLNQLFEAAKKETAASPTEGFDLVVMRQIRRNPARLPFSIFDQLGQWYPRLALAAGTIIVLCVAAELVVSSVGSSLGENAAQLSEQVVLAEN
jgi:hypothetical protein